MVGEVSEGMSVRDSTFLSTFDPQYTKSSTSSAVRTHTSTSYLSSVSVYEDIHPCAYTAKIQASLQDNPTYGDVLQTPIEERREWDKAMANELKVLGDII